MLLPRIIHQVQKPQKISKGSISIQDDMLVSCLDSASLALFQSSVCCQHEKRSHVILASMLQLNKLEMIKTESTDQAGSLDHKQGHEIKFKWKALIKLNI